MNTKDTIAALNAVMAMIAVAKATAGCPGGRLNKAAAEIAAGRFIAHCGETLHAALAASPEVAHG